MNDDPKPQDAQPKEGDLDFDQIDQAVNSFMNTKENDDPDSTPPKPPLQSDDVPVVKKPAPKGFAMDVMHPKQPLMRQPVNLQEPEITAGNEHLLVAEEETDEPAAQSLENESREVQNQIDEAQQTPDPAVEEPVGEATETPKTPLAGWHVPDEPLEPDSDDTQDQPDENNNPTQNPSDETPDAGDQEAENDSELGEEPEPDESGAEPETADDHAAIKDEDWPLSGALPANNLIHQTTSPALKSAAGRQPAMFDTKEYHTPLKAEHKSKKSGSGSLVATLLILLLIIVAAIAVYYFVIVKR